MEPGRPFRTTLNPPDVTLKEQGWNQTPFAYGTQRRSSSRLMLVMKCSRLLRFGSRPSVKLLKVVIGISPPLLSDVGRLLLFLKWRRCGQVRIPDISPALPLAVGLLFPNLDVFAAILDRLTTSVNRRLFVDAAHVGEISGLRYFNLGRLPTDGSARARQQIFQGAPNCFLC